MTSGKFSNTKIPKRRQFPTISAADISINPQERWEMLSGISNKTDQILEITAAGRSIETCVRRRRRLMICCIYDARKTPPMPDPNSLPVRALQKTDIPIPSSRWQTIFVFGWRATPQLFDFWMTPRLLVSAADGLFGLDEVGAGSIRLSVND